MLGRLSFGLLLSLFAIGFSVESFAFNPMLAMRAWDRVFEGGFTLLEIHRSKSVVELPNLNAGRFWIYPAHFSYGSERHHMFGVTRPEYMRFDPLNENVRGALFKPTRKTLDQIKKLNRANRLENLAVASAWEGLLRYSVDLSASRKIHYHVLPREQHQLVADGVLQAYREGRLSGEEVLSLLRHLESLVLKRRRINPREKGRILERWQRSLRDAELEGEFRFSQKARHLALLATEADLFWVHLPPPRVGFAEPFMNHFLGESEAVSSMPTVVDQLTTVHENFANSLVNAVATGRLSIQEANEMVDHITYPIVDVDIQNRRYRSIGRYHYLEPENIDRIWKEALQRDLAPGLVPHPDGLVPPRGQSGEELGIRLPRYWLEYLKVITGN